MRRHSSSGFLGSSLRRARTLLKYDGLRLERHWFAAQTNTMKKTILTYGFIGSIIVSR
ncbi:MAG: hypothetical protein IPG69_14800 [Flavobacteriales bacterium]|nr:hypothetical protein [Flavobacteriales bacterium]